MMALPKLFLLLTLFSLALFFSRLVAESEAGPPEVAPLDASDSVFEIELDRLKSKIQTLESKVSEKSMEVKMKDEVIAEREKIIQDRLSTIDSLQNEIASLEKKGALDAEEQVGKAHARAGELQTQVDKLKGELDKQNKEKVALEARITEAEKKIHDLNSKKEDLERINDKQKTKIRKTESAVKAAEEEMLKAKFEATSRTKELIEVHDAWLPPWLAVHFIRSKTFIEAHWNEHGKPAFEVITQKALEKKAQAGKWAEPHLETIKIKWIPAVKEQWLVAKRSAEPQLQFFTAKTVEVYEASKNAIAPHLNKAQEFVDPYYQEAKKFSKPYIDQVAVAARPHLDKVQVALKPYTKKVVHSYGKFLESAAIYHRQQKGEET
ncbi:uncharacterized protein LOC113847399 isoform X2 [Abrus precatorius]|uniref:Uncharacterized protein LOC113847399 isoform X2 n=1 Tax=Abrus precatorius TaxID=3816 RepID=A0A8B8JNT6_ABRPR|nr:uncharacterized protein LOC113847399 isoform X2 [Abrus precatorius]XP_027332293.1 uncharacterized protein LOC113847399 isoform X2 [Abrus precatorius]